MKCATPVPDRAEVCLVCGTPVPGNDGRTVALDPTALRHLEQILREDTAGEYEIEKPLGWGGMAVVYLATETRMDRKIALKVLPPDLTFGQGLERFKREAKIAGTLDHPGIIPVYRTSSTDRIFWYAMKYVEGRSLDQLLEDTGRLPLDATLRILERVAEALDYAHGQGVVHRDMKPANVLLDSLGRAVVTDFGIAKAMAEGGPLTGSGSLIGTPYYMSPEQGTGKPVTGAADQYSVGVMAYRMLGGRVPFEGNSAVDVMVQHCTAVPPPLQSLQDGLPEHVVWAVHRALAKEPAERFSSVTAFVNALGRSSANEALATAATLLTDTALPSRRPPRLSLGIVTVPRRKLVGFVGTMVAVAAVVGAGMTWLLGRNPSTSTAAAEVAAHDTSPAPLARDTVPSAASGAVILAQEPPASKPATQQTRQTSPPPQAPPAAPPTGPERTPVRTEPVLSTPEPRAAAVLPVAPAVLMIRVFPWADILVNGVRHRQSTGIVDSVPPGQYRVQFRRNGWNPIDTVIQASPGEQVFLRVQLTQQTAP